MHIEMQAFEILWKHADLEISENGGEALMLEFIFSQIVTCASLPLLKKLFCFKVCERFWKLETSNYQDA